MTITTRGNKGTSLSFDEMDENFRDLRFDTNIDRVLQNGNTTTRNLTVGDLTAGDLTATSLNLTTQSVTDITVTNQLYMPNRPAFAASQDNPSSADTPAGYVDNFETVHFNVGNHFDPVTGVFTAPFDGLYHFTYQNIHSNGTNRADISLELNPVEFATDATPSQIESGDPRTIIRVRRDVDETNWNTVTFSVPVILSQNDFVVMYYHDGSSSDNDNYGAAAYWNQFAGYYVG